MSRNIVLLFHNIVEAQTFVKRYIHHGSQKNDTSLQP